MSLQIDDLIDFVNQERDFARADVERARWIYAEAIDARNEARVMRNQGIVLDCLAAVLLGLVVAALVIGRML